MINDSGRGDFGLEHCQTCGEVTGERVLRDGTVVQHCHKCNGEPAFTIVGNVWTRGPDGHLIPPNPNAK
jgi:NAD-dependent SIR2 family protein deacetylase